MRRLRLTAVLLLTTLGLSVRGLAQQTTRENPTWLIESVGGADVFDSYCAPCHGRNGKGGGPVAVALKSRPADLTEIAKRNRGIFPSARIEAFVTSGRSSPAHGTSEMPIWGPTFRSLDPSDTRVKVRIRNLVAYLQSIQVR